MLWADNIVLVGDNWKEVESRYTWWKKASQKKGMKRNVNKTKAFLYKKKFCANANSKVSLLCVWQRSGKELCTVYKMSALGAQEVFWSSWKFNQREGFYLQKMHSWCVISKWRWNDKFGLGFTEVMDRFSYLDVLTTQGGAQEAVTSRIRTAWKKLHKKRMSIVHLSTSFVHKHMCTWKVHKH